MRLPHTVTLLRAPVVSGSYGSQVRNWGAATSTPNVAAFVQPQSSSEQVANEQRVVTRWRIFLDPWADLKAADRVQFDSETFEVNGDVETHRGPAGQAHHLEALLLKVTGG